MQLQLENPEHGYFVRRVEPAAVTVIDRALAASFVMSRDSVIEHWPVTSVGALEPAHLDAILALKPDVVLLGSGAKLEFPARAVTAAFLTRGVGVEVMDNAAAARTFNVLAQEGRKVVAAFILPGA